ncbi:MAG: NADPH-dependent glutamate synthase [Christensenellaceae bacterium]|jgi:glutamate synthase (NADPH/NADH) small chain|nr:NADPH-dependent glutamate synthase [Christensenellaceae bacterium]
MTKAKKNPLLEITLDERQNTFKETTITYDAETAVREAQRCYNCKNARCIGGCPVGVNIPGFISKIATRDFDSAALILKTFNGLPSICGRVCPQEQQCEKKCVKCTDKTEPVAIGRLERFVGDYALTHSSNNEYQPNNSCFKIAVIGSGPASLSCANDCAKAGLHVTVFEALHSLGGVLSYGIPEFRLPKNLVASEISALEKLGVVFKLNCLIGKTITFKNLYTEFDAVFIGTGAGLPRFIGIPGEELNGVYSANEYLTRVNLMKAYLKDAKTPIIRHNRVIVLGGGNVAFDSVRTALRLGSKPAILAYRRSLNELPARSEEIAHALTEGVQIETLRSPVGIISDDGINVSGVEFVKSELTGIDSNGQQNFRTIPNSNFVMSCDGVIVAIGTNPNPIIKDCFNDLRTDSRGYILVDADGKTNINNVFAGGDAVTGADTVISAMGAGKRAAHTIINTLKDTH